MPIAPEKRLLAPFILAKQTIRLARRLPRFRPTFVTNTAGVIMGSMEERSPRWCTTLEGERRRKQLLLPPPPFGNDGEKKPIRHGD